jgi:hypothetical protein
MRILAPAAIIAVDKSQMTRSTVRVACSMAGMVEPTAPKMTPGETASNSIANVR